MCMTAMFLFPVVWDISTTFTMQLLAIASCVGLIGVGLAPDFRDDWINKIHCGSATLTLISSQLWVDCTPAWWVLIPIWLAFIMYIVIAMSKHVTGNMWSDFISTKPMFWVEITALLSTFISLII
ncbi:glycosyl transferase [Parabacteroides sp. GYB001]|uniref:glycosyl transferase n=1 Tax=Parabacteroides leei TaxID=2939491 RepID=UPI00201836A9|nr:glycosyl transferase [Parabacteroides leei]MCL3854715.1 glycosyl transferase [Parabacteroides leei]